MASIELVNLVTTRLVQQKKEIDFQLRNVVEGSNVDEITLTLRKYREIMSDIQLWESLLDEITDIPEEKEDGNNNN
jgi:hypothetical protein